MYEHASFGIMHGMTFDLEAFCDKYIYDIKSRLQGALEGLRDDLESEDEEVRREAAQEVSEILEWLFLSASRKGRGRPRTAAQYAVPALVLHLTTPKSWRQIALELRGCKHFCPACGRRRGKPLEGGFSAQKRCAKCGLVKRTKPEPEHSCFACGDAIRDSVGHLAKFLRRKGLYPTLPRRKDMEGLSPAELEKLFAKLDSN
jgi:hypothetical protein